MGQPYRAIILQPAEAVLDRSLWTCSRAGGRCADHVPTFSLAAFDKATKRLRCVAVAHRPSKRALADGTTVEISLVAPPRAAGSAAGTACAFILARAVRLARRRGAARIVTRESAGAGWRRLWPAGAVLAATDEGL